MSSCGAGNDKYTGGPTLPHLSAINERTALIAQIETASGVEDAEKIAALEEVDCLWVGHFDLSCSLGIPGEFDHPLFSDAIDEVIRACRATDTSLGRLAPDVESCVALYKQGFDFMCYSIDAWAWGDAVKAGLDGIRAGCQ